MSTTENAVTTARARLARVSEAEQRAESAKLARQQAEADLAAAEKALHDETEAGRIAKEQEQRRQDAEAAAEREAEKARLDALRLQWEERQAAAIASMKTHWVGCIEAMRELQAAHAAAHPVAGDWFRAQHAMAGGAIRAARREALVDQREEERFQHLLRESLF